MTVFPYRDDLVTTFNWVFKNQPMVMGKLTQPSSRNQFARRQKCSLKRVGEVVIYVYIYTIDLLFKY